jgi:hypothetical protein
VGDFLGFVILSVGVSLGDNPPHPSSVILIPDIMSLIPLS